MKRYHATRLQGGIVFIRLVRACTDSATICALTFALVKQYEALFGNKHAQRHDQQASLFSVSSLSSALIMA